MNEIKMENEQNIELTNKLLIEMIKNQKQNTSNMIKMFIVTVISMTIIILGTVIGFLYMKVNLKQYRLIINMKLNKMLKQMVMEMQ